MWRMTIYDDLNQNEDSSLMVFDFPQIEENIYVQDAPEECPFIINEPFS